MYQRMVGTNLTFALFPMFVFVNFYASMYLHRIIYKRFFERRLGYIGIFQSKPTLKLEIVSLGIFMGVLIFILIVLPILSGV